QLAEDRRLVALWQEWRGFRRRHPRPFPLTWKSALARMAPRSHKPPVNGTAHPPAAGPASLLAWCRPDWLGAFRGEPPPHPPASGRDRLTRKLYADALGG